jgi:6-phosphogluconolactonase (cycloisomerase 2 family)
MTQLAGLAASALAATTFNGLAQGQTTNDGAVRASAVRSYRAYVGSRTSRDRNARGEGIGVYAIDPATSAWTRVQIVGGLVNPSFLAFNRDHSVLYVAHGDTSEVSALRIDPIGGQLTSINTANTGGKNPAHLVVDPTGRCLIVANHYSSTLAVFPLRDDGSIAPYTDLVTMQGTPGPHAKEQIYARPHQIRFDPSGRFAVVPDKGLDRVFVFRVDSAAGKLLPSEFPSVATRETSGPRHVDFHPTLPFAYVVNELDSTVTTYRFNAQRGALTPTQILSSLPETFTGNSRAAEIEVSRSGRFVYASNRGHDSIVAYQIDASTGQLGGPAWFPAGGKTPRFFALDPAGRALYAANEDSDTIVQYAVDSASGSLTSTGQMINTGSPVCIVFAPVARVA